VIALGGHATVGVGRLIFRQDGQVVVEHGGVVGRVDLEQDLSRLDLVAFLVRALDQHTRNAGDDVGAEIRRQAADQVPGERHRLLLGRHRADFGGRRGSGFLARTASRHGHQDETG